MFDRSAAAANCCTTSAVNAVAHNVDNSDNDSDYTDNDKLCSRLRICAAGVRVALAAVVELRQSAEEVKIIVFLCYYYFCTVNRQVEYKFHNKKSS